MNGAEPPAHGAVVSLHVSSIAVAVETHARQPAAGMESYELWNDLLERSSAAGLASLTPVERTITCVNVFLCDFDNGGLSGFLYNVHPRGSDTAWSELRAIAEAIRQVGAPDCADALLEIAAAVEGSAAHAAPSWGALLEKVLSRRELLEPRIEDHIPQLWDRLDRYTQDHLARTHG